MKKGRSNYLIQLAFADDMVFLSETRKSIINYLFKRYSREIAYLGGIPSRNLVFMPRLRKLTRDSSNPTTGMNEINSVPCENYFRF